MEASGGDAPGRTTATASATTTEETTTGADKGEKEGSSSSTIPDVPSQSLGLFEEQDARDPNMWKKYAWKYIGALVLFLGAYETLHWYVDKVEEENKLRHDKNNEQTTTNGTSSTEEQNADQNEMPFLMAGTSPSVVSTAANTSSVATPASLIPLQQQTQDHQDSDSVDEYWAQMVAHATQSTSIASSELDELYAYKRELEAQLQTAGAGISAELKEELEAVNEEIEIFERKKSSTNK